jgi:hypothetical protein
MIHVIKLTLDGEVDTRKILDLSMETKPKSRQSAKLFLQSFELGPHPLTRRRVYPPPLLAHLLGGEGVGKSQF